MRTVPAILLMMFAASPLAAQRRSYFGAVGGYVSSNWSTDGDVDQANARSGFAVGLTATSDLGSNWVLAPEALYVQKGADFDLGGGVKLTYIEFPVNLHYEFGMGRVRPFLLGGPTIAFKMSCKFTASGDLGSASTDCDEFGGDDANSTDIGAMIGGGIAGSRLSASIRYEFGLSDVSPDDASTIHNRAIFVMLGLRF